MRHVRGKMPVSFPSTRSHSSQNAPEQNKTQIKIQVVKQPKPSEVCGSDLVLDGHDWVVFGGVDVQDMVAVLPAQVVGDVGEGGAGCLGHAVVDDHQVVLAVRQCRRRVSLPQAVLRVALLDLSHLVSGDGSLCGGGTKQSSHKLFSCSLTDIVTTCVTLAVCTSELIQEMGAAVSFFYLFYFSEYFTLTTFCKETCLDHVIQTNFVLFEICFS